MGLLCLALGTSIGVTLQSDRDDAGSLGTDDRVLLSAGGVTENRDLLSGPRYLVNMHNLGRQEVTLEHVEMLGWEDGATWQEDVTVPPGSWATAPLHAAVVCTLPPPAPTRLLVRGTLGGTSFEKVLPLFEDAWPLTMDWLGRCDEPVGGPPTVDELEGIWLVNRGDYLDSAILLHFLPGRRLVLEDGTTSTIYNSARVVGRFTLAGSRLSVEATSGFHCRFGDQWAWRLALAGDDWLHLRLVDAGTTGCRRDLGRVWIAERLAPERSSLRQVH